MTKDALQQVLDAVNRAGIGHNNKAGGQWLLVSTDDQLVALRAALATQPVQAQGEAVAWARQTTIDDDNGRPIGIDEPEVHWGAECPDPAEDWSPLYAHPAPAVDRGLSEAEGCGRHVGSREQEQAYRAVCHENNKLRKENDRLRALAASAPSQADPGKTWAPDGVWEALQRMIEDGMAKGPASREDALVVARHRDRVLLLAARAASQAEPECVVCTRCGHENLIQDGKAPCQVRAPSQAGSCQASATCSNCGGKGYTDAWTLDGEYNPTHCDECPKPAPPAGRTLTDVVNSMPITWELSWGSDDEEAPCNWRVHECSGSRNDREWKLIGEGSTPAGAILAASSTTAGERDHG